MSISREEIVKQVNAVFVEVFEIPEKDLAPEKHLYQDLGLDSIDAIDLVISFESRFKLSVDGDRVKAIKTLNDVYDLVDQYKEQVSFSGAAV